MLIHALHAGIPRADGLAVHGRAQGQEFYAAGEYFADAQGAEMFVEGFECASIRGVSVVWQHCVERARRRRMGVGRGADGIDLNGADIGDLKWRSDKF
ncbi:hypothetical protein D3C72_737140 [compost metagenome]